MLLNEKNQEKNISDDTFNYVKELKDCESYNDKVRQLLYLLRGGKTVSTSLLENNQSILLTFGGEGTKFN